MLTGKELFESGMITNVLEENIQQQGIDVRVRDIKRLDGTGTIPATGKTITPVSLPVALSNNQKWILNPGYYEVEFEEGCNLDEYTGFDYKTRSSLVRCGAQIISGHFDPGFHTDNCGAYLIVRLPITIEKGAKLAQIIPSTSNKVENVYDGQWQNDKQRKSKKND